MNGLYKRDKEAEKSAKKYSVIHWQTGNPKGDGVYIVSLSHCSDVAVFSRVGYHWMYGDVRIPDEEVVSWVALSDIKPYKEETK